MKAVKIRDQNKSLFWRGNVHLESPNGGLNSLFADNKCDPILMEI